MINALLWLPLAVGAVGLWRWPTVAWALFRWRWAMARAVNRGVHWDWRFAVDCCFRN